MTVEANPTQAPEQAGAMHRIGNWVSDHKNAAIAAGALSLAAVVGAGYVVAEGMPGDSAGADQAPALSAKKAAENCDNLIDAEAASNAALYRKDAFLPKTGKIENGEDAQRYVTNLFSANGPLAGKGDYASLAAITSAVVTPSHDLKAVNPLYDYRAEFQSSYSQFNAANGGSEAAKDACKAAFDSLVQVSGYTGNWVSPSVPVTELKAVTNDKNVKVDMQPTLRVNGTTYKGVVLKFNSKTAKGIDDFTEVFIDEDGRMFVKGTTVGVNSNQEDQNQKGGGDQGDNGQKGNKRGGGGTFGTNQGNGESNHPGNVPENGGNGGFTPGPAPSFGPGPGKGGGTPTTTRPQTPPTTRPQTPPTTQPPTTTTTLPPKDPPVTLPETPGGY